MRLKPLATRLRPHGFRHPHPEPTRPSPPGGPRPAVGGLAILIITSALGVAVVAIAFDGARRGRSWADVPFWAGLLIILLPITLRLMGATAQRTERLCLVILLGLALYGVKVLLSPDGFGLHDELGAYRSVADILRTGRLYTPNPEVAAYSSYPGLVSLTAAFARLSGMGIVPCGLVVIAIARALLMGALFLFVERVAQSSRVAGIAVVLYTANPNFTFFDSEFAYESLAIGLAAMVLWMTSRTADQATSGWTDVVIAALLDGALVLTHHLTSYAVAIVILVWAALALITRPRASATKQLVALAGFALAITVAYAVYEFRATQSDIGGSIVGSFHGLLQVITGASSGKAPFSPAVGYSDPPLEQAVGVLSVALLVGALPFSLYVAWRRRRHGGGGLLVLGMAAVLYPASLALRLTAAGSETSNRTSEFVFVGLATVVALAFVTLAGARVDRGGWRGMSLRVLATCYVGLAFVGGITVGTPSYDLLPAGYEVAADSRSIDTEGVDAARWAARWLPPSGYFFSDENDSELLTAYTQLHPQSGSVDRVPIGELFVSPSFGAEERRIIRVDKLRFLVVDQRDSTALPHSGHYFEGGDPESYSSPIAAQALAKFNASGCIDRVLSSGHVVIYDTDRILAGCK